MDRTGHQMTIEITITQLARTVRALPLQNKNIVSNPRESHPIAEHFNPSDRALLKLIGFDPLELHPDGPSAGVFRLSGC